MSQYAVSAPKTPTSTRLCLPTISFEFIIDQQRLNSIFRHLPQAPKNRLAHTAKSLCVRRLLYRILLFVRQGHSFIGTSVVDFTFPITNTLFKLPRQCILPKVFNIKS